MIRISIDVNGLRFSMDGHAGYGPVGSDIVCAACTILATTLISRCVHIAEPGDITECILEPGAARLEIKPLRRKLRAECRVIFAAFREGFELLAQRYPENLLIVQ